MADAGDWRLQGQEGYLTGVTLVHRRYRLNPTNPNWEHDHCEFCWAKFSVDDAPDVIHQGYATEDDYRWICEPCFEVFRDIFRWKVLDALS